MTVTVATGVTVEVGIKSSEPVSGTLGSVGRLEGALSIGSLTGADTAGALVGVGIAVADAPPGAGVVFTGESLTAPSALPPAAIP